MSELQPGRLLGVGLQGAVPTLARTTEPDFRLPNPGHPAAYPTLLIAVFDDSGSVSAPVGSDPLSGRYAEARHAFEAVARRGGPHELGMVVHFDTPSSGEVGPFPLTRRSALALRAGLRVPPDGLGISELGPSLERAQEVATTHADHAVTLVVFSDFLLLDPEPGPVLAALAAFPGDVHAVVLGTRLPAGLLPAPIRCTPITAGDPPGALAHALFSSLTTHRGGSPEPGGAVLSIPQRPTSSPGRGQRWWRRQRPGPGTPERSGEPSSEPSSGPMASHDDQSGPYQSPGNPAAPQAIRDQMKGGQ